MIQCEQCELYQVDEHGRRVFRCDPFTNIKEPECLLKWQLLRLDMLVGAFQGMTHWQQRMAPLQDKIMKYVKRELDELDESESWKQDEDSEEDFF